MITHAQVLAAFEYREDGVLINRISRGGRTRAGAVAGSINTDPRYAYQSWHIYLHGKFYKRPRLIYFMFHKDFPIHDPTILLNHIDGDPLNDRIENLRIATHTQVLHNHKLHKHNKSGCSGVFHEGRNRWQANIGVGGKQIKLGCFSSYEEAVRVRRAAEIKYYGEFRYTGNNDNIKRHHLASRRKKPRVVVKPEG
jgi:hypothetical protein